MDVDGTLTDGKLYMGKDGEIFKIFNIKDGYGIREILIPFGIEPVIMTGRKSEIVKRRCEELGIVKLFQNVTNKKERLRQFANENQCKISDIAYIGDDLNDLDCMNLIKNEGGIIGCPLDAAEEVRKIADYICAECGGNGAVRDFIEYLTKQK